jgi:hypothetical protein
MAYSGLETLFQNMGPAFASSLAGSREADAQYADMQTALSKAEEIQAAKQKFAYNEQNNPLLVQHQGLVNQGLQQGLPGITADSSLKTTNAAKAAGTLSSDIAKGNSANEKAILEDKLAKNTTYMQMAQQFGAQLQASAGQGPGAQEAVRQQMVQQIGPDTQTGKWLASIPTQHLSTAIDKVQEHLVKQSSGYMQALMTAQKAYDSHVRGAEITTKAMLEGKRMDIDAGKYDSKRVSNDVETALMKAPNAKNKAEVLEQAVAIATANGDFTKAAEYQKRFEAARQRVANDAALAATAKPTLDLAAQGLTTTSQTPASTGQTPKMSDQDLLNKYLTPKK